MLCCQQTDNSKEPVQLSSVLFKRTEPQRTSQRNPKNARSHASKQSTPALFSDEISERRSNSEPLLFGQIGGKHNSRLQHIQRACQKCGQSSRYETHRHILVPIQFFLSLRISMKRDGHRVAKQNTFLLFIQEKLAFKERECTTSMMSNGMSRKSKEP